MFKDIHCHLLPGIDDGSKSMEETLEILRNAEKEGVTEIILTPHYMENTKYNCNNTDKKKFFRNLKKELEKANINIKLYLGNEVYITEKFIELIRKKQITTLNNTKYLLFELPLNQVYLNAKQALYELIRIGYVPILAHPERYREFQKHPDMALEYARMGVLLQGNYLSLFGKYGSGAKKTLKILLKKGLITFLGSDMHHTGEYKIAKARKKIKKIVKKDQIVDNLFYNNFDKVVRDEDFEITK